MRFRDRVAVITGGAEGIGRAAAVLLASEGATIAVVDLSATRCTDVVKFIEQQGGRALALEADVRDASDVQRAMRSVLANYGGVDVLVNNVGGSSAIPCPDRNVEELTLEEWQQTIEFNLSGTFLCTKEVLPIMREANSGRIVNLASIISRGDILLANSAYTTAKAGICAFTRRTAKELSGTRITCNAVSPGPTATARIIELRAKRAAAMAAASAPDPRLPILATPEDMARVIAFLASDDAAFVSGAIIEVARGQ